MTIAVITLQAKLSTTVDRDPQYDLRPSTTLVGGNRRRLLRADGNDRIVIGTPAEHAREQSGAGATRVPAIGGGNWTVHVVARAAGFSRWFFPSEEV